MKAKKLLKFLEQLKENGQDLSKIEINFRNDYDSDVVKIKEVSEDLFDEETNSKLRSIVFVASPSKGHPSLSLGVSGIVGHDSKLATRYNKLLYKHGTGEMLSFFERYIPTEEMKDFLDFVKIHR
jgi:hypothetical protein